MEWLEENYISNINFIILSLIIIIYLQILGYSIFDNKYMKNKGILFFIEYFLNVMITVLLPIYILNLNIKNKPSIYKFILVLIIYTYIHILLELSGINSYLYLNNEFDKEKKLNIYELSKNILAIISIIIIIFILLLTFYFTYTKYINNNIKFRYLLIFFIIFISMLVFFINIFLRDGINTKNINISPIILNIIKIIIVNIILYNIYQ